MFFFCSNSFSKFSSKFGASLQDAANLLHLAKKLNLQIVGVSFHVGSNCESALSYEKAIEVSSIIQKFFLLFFLISYDSNCV